MKEKTVKMLPKWIRQNNRYKHLFYTIPIGFFFTLICVVGVASRLEYKDKLYGNKWDWLDWVATIIGGTIGQLL